MKFNSIYLIITFLLIISEISLKKFKNNKKSKSHLKNSHKKSIRETENDKNNDDSDLMLLEKYMELKANNEEENFDEDVDSSDNNNSKINEQDEEYKEDVLFKTSGGTQADEEDDEDEESRAEEKKAHDIDTALLETSSKFKSENKNESGSENESESESLAGYQNYITTKLDNIVLNQNDMIEESKIVQKKILNLINELKKNLK